MWAGYAGTYFWVDTKEELAAIYMSQAPSPIAPITASWSSSWFTAALTD